MLACVRACVRACVCVLHAVPQSLIQKDEAGQWLSRTRYRGTAVHTRLSVMLSDCVSNIGLNQ